MSFFSSAFVQPNCGCLDFHSSDFVSIPGAAKEAAQAYSLAVLLAVGVDDRVKRWRLKFFKILQPQKTRGGAKVALGADNGRSDCGAIRQTRSGG
jgi:hypothetical protein